MKQVSEIAVKPVETDEELRLANDLMAKIHFADFFEALSWLDTSGAGYPNFLREHTRIAIRHGEIAGALRLNTETIRIGEARLKTGGLGWVSTAPRHRHHGVARLLIADTLRYMKRQGYHASMLFGIPNFYHRFGFTTTLAEYAIIVNCAEAATTSVRDFKLRQGKPGDLSAIQRIHNGNDGDVACSLLRSTAHMTNKWDRWSKGLKVLTTEHGKVVAYLNAQGGQDELVVSELGVLEGAGQGTDRAPSMNEDVCGAVLTACAEAAVAESVGRIRYQVPPPHPFARFLLKFASVHEMRVVRDRGGMMTFVDVGEALESMIHEWESLLARSAVRDDRAELTFVVNNAPYRIRANCGAMDVANVPGKNKVGLTAAELMHLVTGYRLAQDVLAARRRIVTPEARALIGVLFPKRAPYVWHFDRF